MFGGFGVFDLWLARGVLRFQYQDEERPILAESGPLEACRSRCGEMRGRKFLLVLKEKQAEC